jgi:DNA-binding transcriptional MerR regulator
MSERILTLFGDEIIPERQKAPARTRAKKTNEAAKATELKPEIKEEVKPVIEEEKNFVLPEDWKGDKQYYTIGEVATLFKVKTSHIRFWTNEFKLKVRTTRKGDRLFTADQVRELRAIHHLVKERGFTLTGAKAKLKSQNKMDVETVDLKKSLTQLRNKLLIIRNQLV